MISVVIATRDSERQLVATLAALVPGALAGLVREVIVADGGSRDGTAVVADVAGCRFLAAAASLGARLKSSAEIARAPWLLFLAPGTVPDAMWVEETSRFVQEAELGQHMDAQAAVFRRAAGGGRSLMGEALALLAAAFGALPRPGQGLIISKRFYDRLGGHRADHADPERDLLRRIGRRRLVRLGSGVSSVF